MLALEYYSFKKELNQRGILFSFAGYISESVLFALGSALRRKLEVEEVDRNIVKRVFSVFVEQVQNVIRYSADRCPETETVATAETLSSGTITVGSADQRFFVICSNVITRADRDILCENLTHLASLDADQLREYYRRKLKEPQAENAQGGSVGLIEIARRSSAPIEFDFLDLTDEKVFFCLKAYI